ncbi:MAG TPA: hypothetical protein ENG92_06310 [Thiolapillus brandeum]|uniref:Uncharacterized protein n=1 Tax=Thiolapillus brandeum TaxID=1076588 RepID=A0A831K4I7_9GAMM|nr:hypothetical protein [Thiolapillus brandeum]
MQEQAHSDYLQAFRGSFTSALRWHHLDDLWRRLRDAPEGWYVYAVGEAVPDAVLTPEAFTAFLDEVGKLLREEHDEDYCGIVYADDLQQPTMVKIYDPNNLGVVCGFSDNPPLPGWVLSRIPPVDLQADRPLPNNRKRWWQRIFS